MTVVDGSAVILNLRQAAMLLWLLFTLIEVNRGSQDTMRIAALKCDDLQRCLKNGSRTCWKSFYEEGSQRKDLIGDVLKVFPEPEFMHFVEESENEMWPEFYQLDKNLTDCMSDNGYRNHIDFCGNIRSSKFSDQLEKAIEDAEKQHQKERDRRNAGSGDQGSKCWVMAMRKCAEQHDKPSETVDNELGNCERTCNALDTENRLGFEVGKKVMLKIVSKIKEAFESSVSASTPKPN